jgi:GNAT superfamily N-acetyltransferase
VLRDGSRLQIRPVRAADEPALITLLQRLDPEEVRLRFFLRIRNFSHDMAARMTQVDYDRELSFVVEPPEGKGDIVAMSTLVMDPDGAEAEYAILVHHDWAGRGIGKHLMNCLLDVARSRGVRMVYGDVLAENGPMLAVARSLGFQVKRDPEDHQCVRVSLRTAPG